MDIRIITAPLVGGLIGLATNGLAIKMLFRPLKPVYIGKYKLPFTPGLIPKERPKMAKAIGDVVSNELLNKETLKSTLLSDRMKNNIYSKVDEFIDRCAGSDDTVALAAEAFVSNDVIQQKLKSAREALAKIITRKAIEQDIGKSITEYAYEEIISKTKPVLKSLASSALNTVKQPFAGKINTMIDEKSRPIIEKFIEEQAGELLQTPLKDIVEKYRHKIPQMKLYFWNVYESIITNRLADILEAINISNVIHDKISQLDLLELEIMIISLIKKELNALIWLGGLLGMLMGFINIILDNLF